MIKFKFFITIFLFFSISNYAQTIKGSVVDKKTNEKLIGASVYIDGTTIGTITDFDGNFELKYKKDIKSPIIISFLGYETKIIEISKFKNNQKIYLDIKKNQLNEVVLVPDTWSRKKKMKIFKREFFGKSIASKDCKILNRKDIVLIHNSSTKTLSAYSDKPIVIKNKYLGYKVYYNLMDFEIIFKNSSEFILTHQVFYKGSSFFTELKKKIKKKQLANREKSYYGSLIHFMKSLSNQQISENKFGIYYNRFPINPYKFFKVSKTNNTTKVEMKTKELSILYNMSDQSKIEILEGDSATFFIDEYGIHSPPYILLQSGDFGKKRISNLLPLDFIPKK